MTGFLKGKWTYQPPGARRAHGVRQPWDGEAEAELARQMSEYGLRGL
jgi:hypothetical protein